MPASGPSRHLLRLHIGGRYRREPDAEKRVTAQLPTWLKERKFVPVVGRVFPLADFRDAFKTMQTRAALGKMVVRIG